jgi:hypothetical protein
MALKPRHKTLLLHRVRVQNADCEGVRGSAVGWGTALQAGRLQFRFPMEPLEFFSDLILPVAASNRNEYQESFLGVKTAGA